MPAGQAIGKSLLEKNIEKQDLSGVGQGRRERGLLHLTCMLCSRWLWTAPRRKRSPPAAPTHPPIYCYSTQALFRIVT